MIIEKNSLSEEQTNKVTVWACTVPSFTLGTLSDQIYRARIVVDDVQVEAARLIREWKAHGKIKFVRGYWKWVKTA